MLTKLNVSCRWSVIEGLSGPALFEASSVPLGQITHCFGHARIHPRASEHALPSLKHQSNCRRADTSSLRNGNKHTPRYVAHAETASQAPGVQVSDSHEDSISSDEAELDAEDRKPRTVRLMVQDLSPETFAPYGQVVEPTEDGTQFGPQDAALEISRGTPRVYVMRLRDKPLHFDRITHHAAVTQCLGAIGNSSDPWYIAVAPPSLRDGPNDSGGGPAPSALEKATAGHYYVAPRVDDVAVFRIDGPQVVKLHVGTWHAGPFFTPPLMDFCNLELADTNVVDHTTHVFRSRDGVTFEIVDPKMSGEASSL